MRKRLLCLLLILSLLLSITACAGKDKNTINENTDIAAGQDRTDQPSVSDSTYSSGQDQTAPIEQTSTQSSTSAEETGNPGELLQSASVDLDSDGSNEEIEVLQIEAGDAAQAEGAELEGVLRIDGKKGRTDTVFIKKQKGLTGVMNSIEFKDLDRDGIKDVFITIPDSGASFSLNYYFIYNYANGKSYKFDIDASLSELAGGFKFAYMGKGKLRMENGSYDFSADFDITGGANGNGPDDEGNSEYERAWVEPSAVEIGPDSKIALSPAPGGGTEIKVPLPVFGLAAVNMIGEVDLYFKVEGDFTPVMKRFEVMDFNGDMSLKKIGEWNGKQ